MNATHRLDVLLNEPSISSNRINQEISIQPISRLTFPERDSYPSAVLPPVINTTVPLPPRRDVSSMKHHRRRPHQIAPIDQQNPHQPLLNSSTLDDLFRALTLECEQYLADTSSYQNKTYGQMIVQPSTNIQTAVESNDDDYENLHPSQTSQPIINSFLPLKTSIQVISPIKRHVVSITVSSKITSPTKMSCITTKSIPPSTIHRSSEEESTNKSSTSTNRKHRRRRARKQILPLPPPTTTRSSSSSTERKEIISDKKPLNSKRSCSTDPRYQRNQTPYDNHFTSSSQKQLTRRPRRRDVSLQHPHPNSGRMHENYSSPLSVLLTSTKPTSDFLDNSRQRQERRSRLESVNQKSSTLLDRLHQQFYQSSPTRNNKNKNNILTHRIPSYPVY